MLAESSTWSHCVLQATTKHNSTHPMRLFSESTYSKDTKAVAMFYWCSSLLFSNTNLVCVMNLFINYSSSTFNCTKPSNFNTINQPEGVI